MHSFKIRNFLVLLIFCSFFAGCEDTNTSSKLPVFLTTQDIDNYIEVSVSSNVSEGFGTTSALEGNTLVIGDPSNDDLENNDGAVFIFYQNTTTGNWDFQKRILLDTVYGNDNNTSHYGQTLALSGDFLAVTLNNTADQIDKVHIYQRNYPSTDNWGLLHTESEPSGIANTTVQNFGSSLSMTGDKLLVGAEGTDYNGFTDVGIAFLYEKTGNTWNEIATIRPNCNGGNYNSSLRFGNQVAINEYGYAILARTSSPFCQINNPVNATVQLENQEVFFQHTGQIASYGFSLSLFEDEVAIANPGAGVIGNEKGDIYITSLTTSLSGATELTEDFFSSAEGYGDSIAYQSNVIAVSALDNNDFVEILDKSNNGDISSVGTLAIPVEVNNNNYDFGASLSISEGQIAVGATGGGEGKVYIYTLDTEFSSSPTPNSQIDFGEILVGEANVQNIIISETGLMKLNVSNIILEGDTGSFVINSTDDFSIENGGGSQTLEITCTPSSSGTKTATLSFSTNDPSNNTIDYPLTCKGIREAGDSDWFVPVIYSILF